MEPFFATHPITGVFCEFRNTLTSDHFHNGLDIPKPDGSPVYPVYDGTVTAIGTTGSYGDNAYVRARYRVSGLTKSDAYVHITPNPLLKVGDSVYAQRTLLGNILTGLGHVHFTHGYSGAEKNAIRPVGGLTPYLDAYPPQILSVRFFLDESPAEFLDGRVSSDVDIRVHIAETNAAGPWDLYSSTTNNGTYIAGYRILSADMSTIVYDPPSSGIRYRFDTKPSDAYVHWAFAPGSDLSTHIYTITNGGGADLVNSTQSVGNGFWNTAALSPGAYVVMVYAEDTRGLADTVYLPVQVVRGDPIPPITPVLRTVENDSTGRVTIRWYPNPEADVKGYRLEFTANGTTWTKKADESTLGPMTSSISYTGVTSSAPIYFRLAAVDTASPPNVSGYSDVYGVRLNTTSTRALVVDGFDRVEASGSYHLEAHPFAMTHGMSVPMNFNTCSNDAVLDGSVLLGSYDVVVWMLGDESSNDETFSAAEQVLVREYLVGGGKLFVSGSEVAYDLDRESGPTQADRDFLHSILKASYAGDDAAQYSVVGVPGSGFGDVALRYGITGEGSPYDEDWPDYFMPADGGQAVLCYSSVSGLTAATGFRGLFGGGIFPGAVAVAGFPFETITTKAARDTLLRRVLTFFDLFPSDVGRDSPPEAPRMLELAQNYPNPFNGETVIRMQIPDRTHVSLKVYDLLGRQVATLLDERREPGVYQVTFNAANLASGLYLLRLNAGGVHMTRSMVLLK